MNAATTEAGLRRPGSQTVAPHDTTDSTSQPRQFRVRNGGTLIRQFCHRCIAQHTRSLDETLTAAMVPGRGCRR